MIARTVSKACLPLVLIVVVFSNGCTAQSFHLPQVPCSNTFQYAYDGLSYYGIITLTNITYGTTRVEIEMTQPGVLNQENSGKLQLGIDQDRVFDYIRTGSPVTYRVDFPLRNVVPRVAQINVNGARICHGPKDPPPSSTMILEHTLRTYGPSAGRQTNPFEARSGFESTPTRQVFNPIITPNMLLPQTTEIPSVAFTNEFRRQNRFGANHPPHTQLSTTTTTTPRTAVAPGPPTSSYINSICGQENMNVNVKRLAVNGEAINRSRFPWIVAIYTSENSSFSFRCGGSLISSRTVVSSAHCFQKGLNAMKAEDLLLSMGLHNLNELDNAVRRRVQTLIRHPDYRPELDNFDADVAILQFTQRVTFSHAIRPICLWQGPTDIRVIEGDHGIVVGWGEDESHTGVVSIPKLVNATIVSELTCIRSNQKLYDITSNRTLCGGNKDGSGPCMGDSGSGLMIRIRNKWMLRGTVSATLGTQFQACNLEEYVVYADIAKFLDWINSNMLL